MKILLSACINGTYFKGKYEHGYKFINKLAMLNGYKDNLNPLNLHDKFIIDNWHPNNIKAFVFKLNDSYDKRNNLLKNHSLKLETIAEIFELLNFPETISFTESSKFADDLYKYINKRFGNDTAILYHSKAKVPNDR